MLGGGVDVLWLLGADEIASGSVKLKRLRDGQEVTVARGQAAEAARGLLK